ncbi:unnamed protein product [Zymoseptoria tritici ST99CH_3D7]|uniref:Uncharacterized protein n=1 Tax=Zymoseptoria tritici (strain ST99CH_3D7) TaxID=1276538 RepID=A0A1X7S8C4_ZYMT9|nr:unnamed protein product [Zymoseptoria tritici ST99CH_3D7]
MALLTIFSITVCKDLMNDNQHCGSCGRICYAPNGAYSCSRGDCVCPNAGDRYCYHSDNTITCSDFKTDRDNCGGCDQRCPAGESCQNGICGQYCKQSETFCAGIGCRDLDSDESSCGICGNSCGEGGTCLGGLCFCPSGYAVCNTLPGGIGGTCRNLYKDHDNCGSCNNICDDKSDCTNGSCQRCIAGSNPGYCPATGGCTNLDEDVQNCGASPNKHAAPRAVASSIRRIHS